MHIPPLNQNIVAWTAFVIGVVGTTAQLIRFLIDGTIDYGAFALCAGFSFTPIAGGGGKG